MINKIYRFFLIIISFFCLVNSCLLFSVDADDYIFRQWYVTPKDSVEPADKAFDKLLQILMSFHTKIFSKDNLLKKLPTEADSNEWFSILGSTNNLLAHMKKNKKGINLAKKDLTVSEFVFLQHEKLLPAMKNIIEKWNNFFAVLKAIQRDGYNVDNTPKIALCRKIQDQLRDIYKEINTSGFSKFNTTSRARQIVGVSALILELTIDKVINELKKK